MPLYATHTSLQSWIDATAHAAPSRIAVRSTVTSLTYAQLRHAACNLARALLVHGAKNDALIAILAHRSVDMIVAVVGVLYSGAAYLPLDTTLPDADLRNFVAFATPVAVVTTSIMAFSRIFGASSLPHEAVELAPTARADVAEDATLPAPAQPKHAAYALFTSGSTGTPKCVVQRHETVLHLFDADRALYGYSATDSYLLVNATTFDISVSDIFNALTTGGELLVASDAELSDDAPLEERTLTRWLRQGAFSVTSMTPSAFRRTLASALVSAEHPPPSRLRLISFSGEGIHYDDLLPVMRRCPRLALVNKYGLTEVQDVTFLQYALGTATERGSIGRPLRGSSLYVLKPAPPEGGAPPELADAGHVGEIAVGGPQVASGYLGAPALTAERFVTDARLGGRLFRTGDAGRWASDGASLFCLGRLDDMLQIRGEIVDVSAAETLLRAAGAVGDVALVACSRPGAGSEQGGISDKRLVAFFTALRGGEGGGGEQDRAIATLRSLSEAKLLPHSRPETYHPVDSFPLTSSGKVHRHRLQLLLLQADQDQEVHAPPNPLHKVDLLLRREVASFTQLVPPDQRKRVAATCNAVRVELAAELKSSRRLLRGGSEEEALRAAFRARAEAAIGGRSLAPSRAAVASLSTAGAVDVSEGTDMGSSGPSSGAPSLCEGAKSQPGGTSGDGGGPTATRLAATPATRLAATHGGYASAASSPATAGNLMGSAVAQLTTFAALNGLVQHEIGMARPVHVPLALAPSPFPRAEFERGRDVLCTAILRLYDAAARDHAWLRAACEGAAADEAARGEEPRLTHMLDLLEHSAAQPLMLGIVRTDFMLHDDRDGRGPHLRQVETNTVSAAFSMVAPRIQRLMATMLARSGRVGEVPVMASDRGVTDALASAHRAAGGDGVVLFVVLVEEHLLCENLMEQQLNERCGVPTVTLTFDGCAERLSLGPLPAAAADADGGRGGRGAAPPLMLDGRTRVTTVYFRGGITPECFGTSARWQARALIEQSSAIKCPSAGWWLAGTKIAQAALCTRSAIARLCPQMEASVRDQLLGALTRMLPAGDAAAQAAARAAPDRYILKREPLGVWVHEQLVDKLDSLEVARDHFLMDKLEPRPVENVSFVRNGGVLATGRGVQELGLYGVYLGDGRTEEIARCVGYLVRTKPEDEADGGVCKGVAVVDAVVLED